MFLGVIPYDTIGGNSWATIQSVFDTVEPRPDWLYPGQTLTVTVSPVAGVSCDGTAYRVRVDYTDPNGTQATDGTLHTMIISTSFQ